MFRWSGKNNVFSTFKHQETTILINILPLLTPFYVGYERVRPSGMMVRKIESGTGIEQM